MSPWYAAPRVNVQLIDAATDEHLWAESYDRTLDDAFAIQSDVARRVVAAVGAVLAGGEQQALAHGPHGECRGVPALPAGSGVRPPARLSAAERRGRPATLRAGAGPRSRVRARACRAVGGARSMHWSGYDRSPERVAAQRAAAAAALRLAPELPEAHVAMGLWNYYGRRDFAAALAELEVALRGLPNDASLIALVGYAHRRLGDWHRVYAAFEPAPR